MKVIAKLLLLTEFLGKTGGIQAFFIRHIFRAKVSFSFRINKKERIMTVPLAFLAVVLIWSTTPLAIKWSGDDVGFLFGVTSRMILGCLLAVAAVFILRISYSMSARAKRAYFASGLGIYLAMLFGYWGARYIPSGWISVLFGLSPLITGILAKIFLHEALTAAKIIGLLSGILGLSVIFLQGSSMTHDAILGVSLVLIGVLGQTSTAVWIKKINAKQHGLAMTAGGLLVSIPLFVLTWFIFDGNIPNTIPTRTGLSIIYLAVFGSLIGFSLYYYLIHHLEASKVSLITMITPVTALFLGAYLNNEPITTNITLGTLLILLGLMIFQWGDKWKIIHH